MAAKVNFRIISKNHAADPEIGFLAKSISKPNGCAMAMPTAWELKLTFLENIMDIFISFIIQNHNSKIRAPKNFSHRFCCSEVIYYAVVSYPIKSDYLV